MAEAVHTCMRCGVKVPASEWTMRNSRGKKNRNCANCIAQVEKRRRIAALRRDGVLVVPWKSKEGRLQSRRRAAARAGRRLITAEERKRLAAPRLEERFSRDVRRAWAKEQLAIYRATMSKNYEAEKSRRLYWANPEKQRARIARYKASHTSVVAEWHKRRQERLANQADGTLDAVEVSRMLAKAEQCAYCEDELTAERMIDHVVPLAQGGKHSRSNAVVCCRSCNLSKGGKSLGEWALKLIREGRRAWIHYPSPVAGSLVDRIH